MFGFIKSFFFYFVTPFLVTPLGILCIPATIAAWTTRDSRHSSAAVVGLSLMSSLVVVSAFCGGIITIPLVLLGVGLAWYWIFAIAYYLSMVTIALFVSQH